MLASLMAGLWESLKEETLTDAATIAVDAKYKRNFKVTLTANRTLGQMSNPREGQQGRFRVVQDGTGGRTLAYDASYEHVGGSPPDMNDGANEETYIYYDVIAASPLKVRLSLG